VISPLDDFLKLSSKKKLDFEKVIEGLAGFKNLRLSFTTRHGDFNPHNILISEGGIGVVDWENYSTMNIPLDDYLHLIIVTSFHLPSRERYPGQGLKHFLLGNGWYRQLVRKWQGVYCSELQISCEMIDCYFPIHLVNMAIQELERNPIASDEVRLWVNALNDYLDTDIL